MVAAELAGLHGMVEDFSCLGRPGLDLDACYRMVWGCVFQRRAPQSCAPLVAAVVVGGSREQVCQLLALAAAVAEERHEYVGGEQPQMGGSSRLHGAVLQLYEPRKSCDESRVVE